MNKKDLINIILFFILATVVIFSSKGGFSSETFSNIMFNVGAAMIGGVICGMFLYGTNLFPISITNKKYFLRLGRNKDMGEKYWISFIKGIDRDLGTVWFVGNRHATWIDKGLVYRRHLKEKIINRINYAVKKEEKSGWGINIILTDYQAVEQWKDFILSEIVPATNYCENNPELIKIGYVNEDSYIPYSIVAHSNGMVITAYTSNGRSADSPTFEIEKRTEVAELYSEDLVRIKNSISEKDWWNCRFE